jgi:hypothetical protein
MIPSLTAQGTSALHRVLATRAPDSERGLGATGLARCVVVRALCWPGATLCYRTVTGVGGTDLGRVGCCERGA